MLEVLKKKKEKKKIGFCKQLELTHFSSSSYFFGKPDIYRYIFTLVYNLLVTAVKMLE